MAGGVAPEERDLVGRQLINGFWIGYQEASATLGRHAVDERAPKSVVPEVGEDGVGSGVLGQRVSAHVEVVEGILYVQAIFETGRKELVASGFSRQFT